MLFFFLLLLFSYIFHLVALYSETILPLPFSLPPPLPHHYPCVCALHVPSTLLVPTPLAEEEELRGYILQDIEATLRTFVLIPRIKGGH